MQKQSDTELSSHGALIEKILSMRVAKLALEMAILLPEGARLDDANLHLHELTVLIRSILLDEYSQKTEEKCQTPKP